MELQEQIQEEYTEYEQLIPELEVNKKAFFVTCDTYVTMEDGTGIVHIAPAFGQDDANVAICVNPNEKYVLCNSMGYKFIVAEKLANKVLG